MTPNVLKHGGNGAGRRAHHKTVIVQHMEQRVQAADMVEEQKSQGGPCRARRGKAGKKFIKIVHNGLGHAGAAR